MAILNINGWDVPAPTVMNVSLFHAHENTGRSASGSAVIDRSALKRRLELRWAHLSGENLAALLGKISGFFDVVYPDPLDGQQRSMQCCCSESAGGILRIQDGKPVWTDVKMTWTER